MQYIMPFVTENISKNSTPEDWRQREAATLAFGSILDGPSPRTLADIVRQAMGFLLAVRPFSCSMLMMGAVPCCTLCALLCCIAMQHACTPRTKA